MRTEMTDTTPAWTRIHTLWPQFLALKQSTAPQSDGMPRAASNPAERALLNLNVLVLEIEITDRVETHLRLNRQRGGNATNIAELIQEGYPSSAPIPEQHVWETAGSDFLEEIESALQLKPRPWTQHKLDLLAEYPDRFQLTQTHTLIALAALGTPINKQTLSMKVISGRLPTDEHGLINLKDAIDQPARTYTKAEK